MEIIVSIKIGDSAVSISGNQQEKDLILTFIEEFKKALKIEYKIG